MKNRKLISLICALAMVFSMFSGLVVNAETAKGIELASAISEDNMTITIDATAVGTEGALSSFGISFNVPEGVEKDDVVATSSAGLTYNVKDGVLTVAFLDMTGEGVEFADGKLATITITLPAALTAPVEFTLLDKSSIADVNGQITVAKGMAAATTTVVPTGMPTPRPASPARPEEIPADPNVPSDVVAVGKGINLAGSIDETSTVVTIEATASETEGALSSFGISFNVPEGVEKDDVVATSSAGLTYNVKDGVLTVAFLDMSGEGVEFADGKLATITITLPSALTAPVAFTLLDKSSIADANGQITVAKGMTAASTVVSPYTGGGEDVEPVKTINLVDYVAEGAADAAAAAEAEGKDVYVTVDMTKKDDTAAVYGTDFTAVYNGKELTAAEFSNLISGYTEDSMADVINGLSFNIYNNDVNKVSTTVNAVDSEGNAEMIADPVDKSLGRTPATPAPKAPKLTTSVSKSTVYTTDKGVKITVKVTNPAEDGVLSYEVSGSAVTNIEFDAETGVLTFDGNAKGTANFTFTYTYTNADGEEATVTAKKSISVKVKSVSDGSSSSSSSSSSSGGDGPIAGGYFGTTTTFPGLLPSASFTDLGSVTWAQEAINTLASMGVISGRGNGIFDPNANITRAEYCQILVGAIGKSQEAADSNFDDVDTNAWYYHSVSVASAYGIVSGYGDGNFGPNNLITRRDMALMTYKAAQVMGVNLTAQRTLTFADADQFDYAAEAVNTLANAGIINGMSETEFAPLANATRAQAAKIIYDTFVK